MNQTVNYGVQPNTLGGVNYPMTEVKKPNYVNPLPEEKIKKYLANGNGLPKITFTEEEMDRAICTHRYNGQLMTMDLPDGRYKCRICGAEFNVIDNCTQEEIIQATQNIHDLLHTAKIMYVDAPAELITNCFQVLAVIDKVPEICQIAESSYRKFISQNPQVVQQGMSMSGPSIWAQILGGAPATQVPQYDQYGNPIYQQPQYVQPQYVNPQQVVAAGNYVPQQVVAGQPQVVYQQQPGQPVYQQPNVVDNQVPTTVPGQATTVVAQPQAQASNSVPAGATVTTTLSV